MHGLRTMGMAAAVLCVLVYRLARGLLTIDLLCQVCWSIHAHVSPDSGDFRSRQFRLAWLSHFLKEKVSKRVYIQLCTRNRRRQHVKFTQFILVSRLLCAFCEESLMAFRTLTCVSSWKIQRIATGQKEMKIAPSKTNTMRKRASAEDWYDELYCHTQNGRNHAARIGITQIQSGFGFSVFWLGRILKNQNNFWGWQLMHKAGSGQNKVRFC